MGFEYQLQKLLSNQEEKQTVNLRIYLWLDLDWFEPVNEMDVVGKQIAEVLVNELVLENVRLQLIFQKSLSQKSLSQDMFDGMQLASECGSIVSEGIKVRTSKNNRFLCLGNAYTKNGFLNPDHKAVECFQKAVDQLI